MRISSKDVFFLDRKKIVQRSSRISFQMQSVWKMNTAHESGWTSEKKKSDSTKNGKGEREIETKNELESVKGEQTNTKQNMKRKNMTRNEKLT
jgi:hypothetical protein